jgi:hypothetical protein
VLALHLLDDGQVLRLLGEHLLRGPGRGVLFQRGGAAREPGRDDAFAPPEKARGSSRFGHPDARHHEMQREPPGHDAHDAALPREVRAR